MQEYDKKNRNDFYSSTFLFINAIGCVGCSGLLLLNRMIASFLFINDFYQAWQYVPFLLLSVLFNQTAGFIGPLLSAKKESYAMAIASIAGSVANLFFNIVLIKLLGVQGAALATALSSFIIYFIRWWYARDLLNSGIYIYLYSSWIVLLANSLFEIFGLNYAFHIAAFIIIAGINFNEIKLVINQIRKRRNQ